MHLRSKSPTARLMSGPSTLATSQPCWGCGALPTDGVRFQACNACAQLKLIPSSFCSLECQKEHWPRHDKYHRKAQRMANKMQARLKEVVPPEAPNDEYWTLCHQSLEHLQAGDPQKAGKVLRLAIRQEPERPIAYARLASVLKALGDDDGACRNYLLAESRFTQRDSSWAHILSAAIHSL